MLDRCMFERTGLTQSGLRESSPGPPIGYPPLFLFIYRYLPVAISLQVHSSVKLSVSRTIYCTPNCLCLRLDLCNRKFALPPGIAANFVGTYIGNPELNDVDASEKLRFRDAPWKDKLSFGTVVYHMTFVLALILLCTILWPLRIVMRHEPGIIHTRSMGYRAGGGLGEGTS